MLLKLPKFIEENFGYFDKETKTYKLKNNAPEWAVKEAEEYDNNINKPFVLGKWEEALLDVKEALKTKKITQQEYEEFVETMKEFYE